MTWRVARELAAGARGSDGAPTALAVVVAIGFIGSCAAAGSAFGDARPAVAARLKRAEATTGAGGIAGRRAGSRGDPPRDGPPPGLEGTKHRTRTGDIDRIVAELSRWWHGEDHRLSTAVETPPFDPESGKHRKQRTNLETRRFGC
jgi:hypothetical protein